MLLRPAIARSIQYGLKEWSCVFCQLCNTQRVRHYTAPRAYKVTKRDQMSKTPQEIRIDIDKRNRYGFLTMMKMSKLLAVDPNKADEIIADFIASEKDRVDAVTNIKQVAEKHNVTLDVITYIAIPLFRIADVKDTQARLPPSQHPKIASHLLFACSAAGEVHATLQILYAVYLGGADAIPQARDVARLFSTAEINECRNMLEKAAAEGNTDAMTLQGLFLERAGQRTDARALYEKAVEICDTKYDPKYPHPMALPWTQPWQALASLLLVEKSPEARAKASVALEKGANKADDPLAYYQLAELEQSSTPNWLRCMSKAAASGHLEAAYKLGHFYMGVHADPLSFFNHTAFMKALQFLKWRPGSTENLAREWFEVAAEGGHKPAMFELVELFHANGEEEKANDYLQRIRDLPQMDRAEEWPRLVEQAKVRLARQRIATSRPV